MMIIVHSGIADDLKPLVDALGAQGFDVLEWDGGAEPPNRQDPVLLDLRAELDLTELFGDHPEQPLVAVTDLSSAGKLADLPATSPWAFVPIDWAVDQAAVFIARKVEAWERRILAEDKTRHQLDMEVSKRKIHREDQSISLMVKNSELSRMQAFKAGVLSRLGDAERGYIADILRQVTEFEKHDDLPNSLKNIQNNLHHTAVKIQHIFRSFDYWEKTERELEGRTILVCLTARKTRKMLQRALGETKAKLHITSTWQEGLEVLRDSFVDLLYIDWENSQLIHELPAVRPDVKTVLLTSDLLFEAYGSKMVDLPLENVLITSDAGLTENDEDPLMMQELTVTAGKLLGDSIFGLEKYLSWGTKIHEILVTSSVQRLEVLDKIGEFAPSTGLRRSMCQNLETLTDELLMNAVWDAPVDETGHHKYATLSRRKAVQLLPHECPILRFGADKRLVGISVTDPFGGLEREQAYKYLIKCFSRAENQIDSKRGGAGLGLYTAFLSVSSFIINVAPGFRTEVIGLLDNKLSRRKLSGRSRTYHYFLSQGPPPRR